jgi:glycosyltransferase involved in cell wall biosynthesis
MGRYVRPLLAELAIRPTIALTLLVRDVRAADAYRAIVGERIDVAPLKAARAHGAFDSVWYPWNGIRFGSSAPAVVTINDDFAFAYPARGFVARRREQGPIRRALADAAGIATISAWSRDALIGRFDLPPHRVSVIPLRPDAFFTPAVEPSPFAEPFVLTVGAGEPRKNLPFLVEVFAAAFPRDDVRLVVVGDPEPIAAARLAAAHFPVSILRKVDDERLRALYRTAAVVAVPSVAEGFGLVAAEAQACAAVVIAANTSALPETVGEAGHLIDPRDAAAWRDALRELVIDPASSARFRALAARRWSSDSGPRTADALLAVLERTIHDRP